MLTLPVGDVSDTATGSLQLVGADKSKVRLFFKSGDTWTYVTAGTGVTAAELRAGLELGVDGHHLQRVKQALVVDGSRQNPNQRKFTSEFPKEVRKAGITKPTYKFKDDSDIWPQDFVEPGYVSIPGPGGKPRVLHVMIRSAQMDRKAGKQVFEMRGPGVGVAQVNEGTNDQINSTGNLETTPPYTHNGKSYPAAGSSPAGTGPGCSRTRSFSRPRARRTADGDSARG
ncbi:hypothetical protein SGFS_104110 [Streptomyces graminofaciens]|uniref:Protein-arginine deiminase C-terminal domain-containing protein n=1 Tax=Streptomyces graminofaciens TaxID=68212 RepID=A0ABN5W070_9ACTN|nr:protein-arginine deiminase family protein [Streptomyces graminofaciens]BBC39117.1 hypothetical protein SGFS_104110 [Streptomyces graminofaciens]